MKLLTSACCDGAALLLLLQVLMDACWALSYLSDGQDERLDPVLAAGAVPLLVALLQHSSDQVIVPALRTVGNIVSGDTVHTQAVLDAGALPLLEQLLHSNKKGIKKEATWAFSNIAA
jgi:importin subunit alpha-6/7